MRVDRPHLRILADVRPELAGAVRQALPEAGEAVIAAIRESVDEYAQPLEGRFGQAVRTGVGEALSRFAEDIERPGEDPDGWSAVYENLGRGELRQGRTLDALLAAYRIGARVSWRAVADAAREAGATPQELTALAEAIFAYIDEISALSARGYAAEQALAAGETQRRRSTLVRLLVEGAGAEAIDAAAAAAGWSVPEFAAVVVAEADDPAHLAGRIGLGAIAAEGESGQVIVVVPDPGAPGREAQIQRAVPGAAGQGPDVDPADLVLSAQRAELALTLAIRESAGLVRAEHRMADLIVQRDPALLRSLADRELAALEGESDLSRARLTDTLRAWLDHPGRPTAVARAVHVHPQTARYRLERLRDLLGDIDDPDRRFRLALALRSQDAGAGAQASWPESR